MFCPNCGTELLQLKRSHEGEPEWDDEEGQYVPNSGSRNYHKDGSEWWRCQNSECLYSNPYRSPYMYLKYHHAIDSYNCYPPIPAHLRAACDSFALSYTRMPRVTRCNTVPDAKSTAEYWWRIAVKLACGEKVCESTLNNLKRWGGDQ